MKKKPSFVRLVSSWQSKTTIALEEIFSLDKTTVHAPLKPAFDLKPLTIIRHVF